MPAPNAPPPPSTTQPTVDHGSWIRVDDARYLVVVLGDALHGQPALVHEPNIGADLSTILGELCVDIAAPGAVTPQGRSLLVLPVYALVEHAFARRRPRASRVRALVSMLSWLGAHGAMDAGETWIPTAKDAPSPPEAPTLAPDAKAEAADVPPWAEGMAQDAADRAAEKERRRIAFEAEAHRMREMLIVHGCLGTIERARAWVERFSEVDDDGLTIPGSTYENAAQMLFYRVTDAETASAYLAWDELGSAPADLDEVSRDGYEAYRRRVEGGAS